MPFEYKWRKCRGFWRGVCPLLTMVLCGICSGRLLVTALHVFVGVKWGISVWTSGWQEHCVAAYSRTFYLEQDPVLVATVALDPQCDGGCGHWWAAPVKCAGASPFDPWGFPASQVLSFWSVPGNSSSHQKSLPSCKALRELIKQADCRINNERLASAQLWAFLTDFVGLHST